MTTKEHKEKQYYTLDGHCLFIEGGYFMPDEVEFIDKMNKPSISFSPYELAQIFPEAKSTIKRIIKEDKIKLNNLYQEKLDLRNRINSKGLSPQKADDAFDFMNEYLIAIPTRKLQEKIETNEKILKFIDYKNTVSTGNDLSLNIAKAKDVPIPTYLDFNRAGFTKCLWHDPDRNPSLSYRKKTNRVKCFSCGEGGDVIDVIQKIHGVEFLEAIKIILK